MNAESEIKLTVNSKEMSLTREEAEALYLELKKVFGKTDVYINISSPPVYVGAPVVVQNPQWYNHPPYYGFLSNC